MRLLVTADLHFNHARSKPLAEDLVARMNRAGGDVLLVVGDTATADGDSLEQCLSLFDFTGPKLFLSGNHELWTRRPDSHAIFANELPDRVRRLGWRWLEGEPFWAGDVAIVGSVGWYDYSFAEPALQIPRRFYEMKVSPGAAARRSDLAYLLQGEDVTPHAMGLVARWNDGKFVKLHQTDEQFLTGRLTVLERSLESVLGSKRVIAAVHHLPFEELLPARHFSQWDFAKAYLGSRKIGELLRRYPNLSHVYCGHSHVPAEVKIDSIHAINIGSGYGWKTWRSLEVTT